MGRFTFGVILRVAIGIIDVLLMLPLAFPDKPAALVRAFSSRFALVSSLRSSRADVTPRIRGPRRRSHEHPRLVVTKASAPILNTGVVFGAVAE